MKEDKVAVGAGCALVFVWLISIALSLGLTGVVIWAIIKLVHHFAS